MKGSQWCVYTADGKKELGCHKTKIQAHGQLQAIEASKHKKKGKK